VTLVSRKIKVPVPDDLLAFADDGLQVDIAAEACNWLKSAAMRNRGFFLTRHVPMEPRRHLDGVAMEPKAAPSPGVVRRGVLAVVRGQDYIAGMDTGPRPDDRPDILSPETEAERRDRLTWEAEGIAKAEASLAAGLYVDADEIDAWIDSIGTDREPPPPPTRRR